MYFLSLLPAASSLNQAHFYMCVRLSDLRWTQQLFYAAFCWVFSISLIRTPNGGAFWWRRTRWKKSRRRWLEIPLETVKNRKLGRTFEENCGVMICLWNSVARRRISTDNHNDLKKIPCEQSLLQRRNLTVYASQGSFMQPQH